MTQAEYIHAISREPLETMIREKEGYKYIPISVIQPELLLVYQGLTKWEMTKDVVTPNGLWGIGVLHYKLPFGDREWVFQSGTASIPISKKMRLSYPSLEAHCMMNAAKKIGPWFGQNLNRGEEDEEDGEIPVVQVAGAEAITEMINKAKTLEELGAVKPYVTSETNNTYMRKVRQLSIK